MTNARSSQRVLVTGVTGQDGSYLAEQLVRAGHTVFGLVRPGRSAPIAGVTLVEGDMRDPDSLVRAVEISAPDEIYNLAAETFVPASWNDSAGVHEANALGVEHLAAAMRGTRARLCHASSAEIFGPPTGSPQNEDHPILAETPYGLAKAHAHRVVAELRERGAFACSAILFNHESPRRPPSFVTRKITMAVARIARAQKTRIARGESEKLVIGSLASARDWGYAPEYMEAMQLMMHAPEPRDYVVATGRPTTVARFAELAFAHAGLDWRAHVVSDPAFVRAGDTEARIGDASRIARDLGWSARTGVEELVRIMVDAELAAGDPATTSS